MYDIDKVPLLIPFKKKKKKNLIILEIRDENRRCKGKENCPGR